MNTSQPITNTFGPTPERTTLSITTWTDHEGISINVFTAGRRNSTLSATFLHADRAAAEAWYVLLRDMARSGVRVWEIEDAVAVLIAASMVLADAENSVKA